VSVIPIDWPQAKAAAEQATSDFAGLLRNAPNGDARVPGLAWNVGELGAHLVTCAMRYTDFAHGEPSTVEDDNFDAANADWLRRLTDRDPRELAEQLAQASEAFLKEVEADDSRMSMSGVPVDKSVAACILLNELRVHGLDLSRAVGKKGSISPSDALLINYAALNLLPALVGRAGARDFNATFEVRFRGGETVAQRFHDGTLTITRGAAPSADCRMSVDPTTALLVAYGRIPRWRAALSGKILAWGRKPWLLLTYQRLLPSV
jgi:uncharacterized protein (TIGR03083 family)